ncbi:ubiquitin-conjugating enzyme/RWD-like protein [Hyaloraphidium curvatum]|nr:ubiquitin-conjugating enzyme/RWD-like protein [Hyaloraphidium curvatum]
MYSESQNLGPGVLKRIARELAALEGPSAPDGIKLLLGDGADMTNITAVIEGPAETPFHGGAFRVRLQLLADYPAVPPRGFFVTKIFHPNVSASGEICVNTLKRDWRPELTLKDVLLTIKSLLFQPNPDSALNEEAAKLLVEDHDAYCRRAALFTSIHAVSHLHLFREGKGVDRDAGSVPPDPQPASASGAKAQGQAKKSTLRRL